MGKEYRHAIQKEPPETCYPRMDLIDVQAHI